MKIRRMSNIVVLDMIDKLQVYMNTIKRRNGLKGLMVLLISCWCTAVCGKLFEAEKNIVDYVNPLMGTASTPKLSAGNTYPTISLPFGMNTWSPQTGTKDDGGLYTYTANYMYGIRQTRQASYWIKDYGQFSLMPVNSREKFSDERRKSWFSHKTEVVHPYYYRVYLADHHTHAEITATERAAVLRFSFHPSDSAFVTIDAFDEGSYIKIIPEEQKIIGFSTKNNGGVPSNFRNYFVIVFDQPFFSTALWDERDQLLEDKEHESEHVGAILGFQLEEGEQVQARVASSFISFEQAALNLEEVDSRNFEEVKQDAKRIWNRELGKVRVKGGSLEQRQTFYSCLYRMLIFPRKFYEWDKDGKAWHYSPYSGEVLPGYLYADNGFWDTFRAQFPFLTLAYPSIVAEVLQSMENTYYESGWLPEWFSPGHRDCMIGSHSASIIADAYLKGVRGDFNIDTLYKAILKNTRGVGPVSSVGRLGAEEYNLLGYVPFDIGINQNLSRTLEYAYNDFNVAKLAEELGRPESEISLFKQRSLNYRNLFDVETGLMRPKSKGGHFLPRFDPFKWGDHITEGNSWHYSWSVFHDPLGLADLHGGISPFITKMDSVFALPPVFDISYYKRGVIHLVREMQGVDMGQYAHLNEPMHHFVYLYNFGAPWKTQYWARQIMDKLYSPDPDGYPGEEDNGQMSAWYVFSALGFYPLCPGSDQYVFGSPLFDEAVLTLENGRKITINATNTDPENVYIERQFVNGKSNEKNWVSHQALENGGSILFEMSGQPNKNRGVSPESFPYSLSQEMTGKIGNR